MSHDCIVCREGNVEHVRQRRDQLCDLLALPKPILRVSIPALQLFSFAASLRYIIYRQPQALQASPDHMSRMIWPVTEVRELGTVGPAQYALPNIHSITHTDLVDRVGY